MFASVWLVCVDCGFGVGFVDGLVFVSFIVGCVCVYVMIGIVGVWL